MYDQVFHGVKDCGKLKCKGANQDETRNINDATNALKLRIYFEVSLFWVFSF